MVIWHKKGFVMTEDTYLQNLNPKQKLAVLANSLDTLVLAGAGSGKTRVLTRRIVKHIRLDLIDPSAVMALTFTNKAAKEMTERVAELLSSDLALQVFTGTFHSFCARFLRKNHALINLSQSFEIIDDSEQKQILKDIVLVQEDKRINDIKSIGKSEGKSKEQIAEEVNKAKEYFKDIISIVSPTLMVINALKNKGLGPSASEPYFAMQPNIGCYVDEAVNLFKQYEIVKHKDSKLDFNDLIIKSILILKKHADVREGIRAKFKAILVDEYQDTNALQSLLLKLIRHPKALFTAVGDEDQLVYEWRGAEIKHILNYSKAENVNVIILDQNYRSTKTILGAANDVIKENDERIGKNLWTSNLKGDPIEVVFTESPFEEADYIAKKIKERTLKGESLNDFTILCRNRAITSIIEKAFHKYGITATIVGGTSFWAKIEVKAMVNYMKWAANPNNATSIRGILGLIKCGYGDKTHLGLVEKASQNRTSVEVELQKYCATGKPSENKSKVAKQLEFVRLLRVIYKKYGLKRLVKTIALHSGLKEFFEKTEMDKEKFNERTLCMEAVLELANEYENDTLRDEVPLDDLNAFIASTDLQIEASKNSSGKDSVKMMTIHASKGLEFKNVILAGADEGVFPSFRAIEEDNLEEERRLAYVAITRARKKLYITTSKFRFNKPTLGLSQFVFSISMEHKSITRIKPQYF